MSHSKMKSAGWLLALLSIVFTVLSFSNGKGGDSFKIFLNNKLLLEQFVLQQKTVKTISVDPSEMNGQLTVYYSHCGQVGKGRNISITDAQNKVLKQYKFADAGSENAAMSCQAKEIAFLEKNNERLNIYYSSRELPGGKLLAVITANQSIPRP